MNRKDINEKLNIPYSNLSEWSKKSDDNWRKRIYILLSNIDDKEVDKLLLMGDVKNMSLEELENNMELYIDVKETE